MFNSHVTTAVKPQLKNAKKIQYNMAKKKIEIQPGFEPWSSELWPDALTNLDTGAWPLE